MVIMKKINRITNHHKKVYKKLKNKANEHYICLISINNR